MGVLDKAKKLNKEFEDETLSIKADVNPVYRRMPTGAFGLDYPLYGGLPYGRIVTFAGLFHSGKTTAACLAMAAYQRVNPDKTCVYVDVEHSLDRPFQARMTGLDLTKLLYVNPKTLTGEQILDYILELQKEDDIGMIVIDSLPALLPAASLEADMEKDPGMRGTIAKSLHRFLATMSNLVNNAGNILVLINQVRISGYTFTGAPIYSEPTGQSSQYYSSIKVRFGTRTFIKGDKVDASDGEGAEGFRLKFAITKNKCGPVARGGGFLSFNYDRGFMWLDDLVEIASKFGFIIKGGSYYTLINLETGEPYLDSDGKPLKNYLKNLKTYISENIEFQKEYVSMLNKYISAGDSSYGNILDARDSAEIKSQDDMVEGVRQGAINKDSPKN
jgi:protein RecA